MQKLVSYLAIVMIASTTLMSCNNKSPVLDDCVLILVDYADTTLFEEQIFMMYPNPAVGEVRLWLKTEGQHTIAITDDRGKVLFKQSIDSQNKTIDISSYPVGKYRVIVDNGSQKSILCLIKVED